MAENVFEDRALQTYLNQIAEINPLPREEEYALAYKAQKGDKEAVNKLVRSNLKFVVKVASRYQNRGLSLAELISEGNLGLIKAIEKFDPKKDNKLISYAVWWIKQKILFALAEKTNVIRMPLGKANIANKIKIAKEKYFSETGDRASVEDLSELTDLNKKAIHKIKRQSVNTISIEDSSYTSNQEKVTLDKFLKDDQISDPQTLYYRKKVHNTIERSIESLTEREALIINEYFGLSGSKGKNFAQIGDELNLSRERVRQIQKKALEKILKDVTKELGNNIDYILYNNKT